MSSFQKIILLFVTAAILHTGFEIFAEKKESAKSSTEDCYTPSEIEENDISLFRDNYIPVEYHPEPVYLAYMDIAALFLILIAGFKLIYQKRRKINIGFLALTTFFYFGLFRGGCICPVGAVANVSMGLMRPELVGRVTVLIFLMPLIFALISGRIFCTAGCPLGAVQHLLHKKKKFLRLPRWLNKISISLALLVLIATAYLAIQRNLILVCSLDPYKAIFFTGHAWIKQVIAIINGAPMENVMLWACGGGAWLFLIIILIIGYWIPRPFCRFICPYGVLLGGISTFAFIQRKIDKESCTFCRQCEKICPTGAIHVNKDSDTAKLSNYSCIQCNRCTNICKEDAV